MALLLAASAVLMGGCHHAKSPRASRVGGAAETGPVRKALVIAIDGLRPDALEAADAPNIHAMIRAGCYSNQAQCEDLTFSGPNHSSILHGVHRDKHNVTSNDYKGNRLADWPDFFAYLERFDSNLNTFRFHTWKEAHENQPTGADAAIFCDYEKDGDEDMTRQVVQLLSGTHPQYKQDPDVVFMFYSDVDEAGHAHGFHPAIPGYQAEITNVDAQVGRVLTAMRGRPDFRNEDWLIILTTDHGGSADKGHSGGTPERRTIPFLVCGPQVVPRAPFAPPKNVDVAKTLLTHMLIEVQPEWELDGHCVGICACQPGVAAKAPHQRSTSATARAMPFSASGIMLTDCEDCFLCGHYLTWAGPSGDRPVSECCLAGGCACLCYRVMDFGRNLIWNGDAEYDRGFSSTEYDQAISGWDDPGPDGMTVIAYDSPDGYPTSTDPGPAERGRDFFAGGRNAESRISQTIDVLGFARDIAANSVRYDLSGWLGGFADQGDHAELTATFLDAGGQMIGKAGLAPVTVDDRDKKTGLWYRETQGDVPPRTTHIRVELRCSRSGDGSNDGYADNLALVLYRR